jgi:hypothetical protein
MATGSNQAGAQGAVSARYEAAGLPVNAPAQIDCSARRLIALPLSRNGCRAFGRPGFILRKKLLRPSQIGIAKSSDCLADWNSMAAGRKINNQPDRRTTIREITR